MSRRRLPIALCGVILALLSGIVWQFRFERAGADLKVRLGQDFEGWTVQAGDRIGRKDGTWTLRQADGGAKASAATALPGLDDLRFVRVRIDVAWEEVTRRDNKSWWSARVSLAGKNPQGRFNWPADGDLVNAVGTRGWHPVEWVMDLPPNMGEPHLFINNLAATGILKVRDLRVTPVRQRPWIPAATVVLLVVWALWVAWTIGREKGRLRQFAAALGLVAAAWYLVFPQPSYHARPFPGGFLLGREIVAPAVAAPLPAPAAIPSEPSVPPAATPSPPMARPPATETRTGHPEAGAFRKIDRDLPFAHGVAFLAFGLAVFTLAGLRHTWPLATAIAVLSEVIPNILRDEFMADDAMDLVANLTGLAVAALLVWRSDAWIRRKKAAES